MARTFKEFLLSINYQRIGRIGSHALLVGGMVASIAVCSSISTEWSTQKANALFGHLKHGKKPQSVGQDAPESKAASLDFASDVAGSTHEKDRLRNQLDEVRGRARFHLETMVFVFANHYMELLLLCFTGAIAAIALALISKSGWANANEYLVSVFFVMTAATVMYGAFPGIFKQEQSVHENKLFYLRYVVLENDILTFAATGQFSRQGELMASDQRSQGDAGVAGKGGERPGVGLKRFIVYVDQQLAQGDIPIGLDSSKAPKYTGAFEIKQ